MNNAVAWVAIAISVVSASISLASYWTNREKLRLDLYDRRFNIYKRSLDLYTAILKWGPTPQEIQYGVIVAPPYLDKAQKAFVKASFEAQFLFSRESGVPELLKAFGDDAYHIFNFRGSYGPQLAKFNPEGYVEEHKRYAERMRRFMGSMEPLREGMAPFLDFHRYSALPRFPFEEANGEQWP
jgi:hypothetical protein